MRFAFDHNFDTDERSVLRVFIALRASLLLARNEASTDHLSVSEFEAYEGKQAFLNAKGVTTLACRAIATHPIGSPGSLGDEAVTLLCELLNAGNVTVQVRVYYALRTPS